MHIAEQDIETIYTDIKGLINNSRNKIYQVVNTEMLHLYWNIGKKIIDIQEGETRAKYGEYVLKEISVRLTKEFGKGFSIRNLRNMRKFYEIFQKWQTVIAELSWTHYLQLIKIKDTYKREFYIHEAINSNWSVRKLQRQIDSLLYERLAVSKNKKELLELSQHGQVLKTGKELIAIVEEEIKNIKVQSI